MLRLEATMRRSEFIRGEPVRLANGEDWLVPLLAFVPSRAYARMGDDGRVVFDGVRPDESTARVFDRAAALLDDLVQRAGDGDDTAANEHYQACLDLLAVNYSLTPEIVPLILTQHEIVPIMLAAFGLKKKLATRSPGSSTPACA